MENKPGNESNEQPLKKTPEGNTKTINEQQQPEEIIRGAQQEDQLEQLKPSTDQPSEDSRSES